MTDSLIIIIIKASVVGRGRENIILVNMWWWHISETKSDQKVCNKTEVITDNSCNNGKYSVNMIRPQSLVTMLYYPQFWHLCGEEDV